MQGYGDPDNGRLMSAVSKSLTRLGSGEDGRRPGDQEYRQLRDFFKKQLYFYIYLSIYIYLNHFAIYLKKITTLYINYTLIKKFFLLIMGISRWH